MKMGKRGKLLFGITSTGVVGAAAVAGTILVDRRFDDIKYIENGEDDDDTSSTSYYLTPTEDGKVVEKSNVDEVSTVIGDSGEVVDLVDGNLETTTITTTSTDANVTLQRPGRIGVKDMKTFRSGNISKGFEESYKNLASEDQCKNKGGKWVGSNCKTPEVITKEEISFDSWVESEEFTRLSEEECFNQGGYYKNTTTKNSSFQCLRPGIMLKKDYEEEISSWEKVENVEIPDKSKVSLVGFYNNGFFDIRKKDNQFAVLFPKDKMVGELENWKFPQHLKQGIHKASVDEICEWSKKSMGDNWTTSFLYNEKSGEGWHCNGKKEIIFFTNNEDKK